jgi:hypothetical protein
MHYKKPVIVELVPGDVIRLRLYGQRLGSAVSIQVADLYYGAGEAEVFLGSNLKFQEFARVS